MIINSISVSTKVASPSTLNNEKTSKKTVAIVGQYTNEEPENKRREVKAQQEKTVVQCHKWHCTTNLAMSQIYICVMISW